jgi:hypothetical protein
MHLELAPVNGVRRFTLEPFLDDVCELFQQGQIDRGMNSLLPALKAQRLACEPREWAQVVEGCLRHRLRAALHQDPFTHRAFAKPRGYAGDAVLLDYIYSREEGWPPPKDTTELGRAIFDYTTRSAACEGVRARRGFLADLLDRHLEQVARPHVLSVAAGHLREAELCAAVKRRKLGRYVALDSDVQSLQEVERCYGRFGVEPCRASIRQLVTERVDLGSFDLVYSTGLFDYLQQPIAQRLAWVMFQMLRPGGQLLIANFLPGVPDLGYMESYMDWKLIFRARVEMVAVSADIPEAQIRDLRLFAEENRNIIFLQVTKQ